MASCPIITGTDPSIPIVQNGITQMLGYAAEAFDVTMENISSLNAFDISPYQFQVSFNFDGQITPFQRPSRPSDPDDIDYDPDTTLPVLASIQWPSVQPGTAPTFTAQEPTIHLPTPPSVDLPPVPDAPVLADIVLPPVPTYDLPPVPTLRTITLPPDPSITIPTFSAIAPVRTWEVPNFDFSFEVPPYSSALLDAVKARLATMLQGGTGLPQAIERALYDRATAREDESDLMAETEAVEQFSSRGWKEPNGILSRRLARVRQQNRLARAGASRDTQIRATEIELENLRFSVTQGIALETILIDLHLRTTGLLLEAAKFYNDTAMRVLEARIAVLNADTALFQAKAAVFRDLIAAELAKLDVYRAQLESKRLIGDLNAQDVALYEARLRTIDVLVGIYKAQVDGQNAVSANNNSRIQGFNGLVQARSETIRGLGFQFDAYKTQTEAERVKGEIYDISARAFGSRVSAYSAIENLKIERGRFDIAKGQAVIDEWKTRVQGVVEKMRADALKVTTKLDKFRAFLDRYRTDAGVEQTASDVAGRQFAQLLERERAQVDTQLKNVQLIIDQNEKIYGLLLEAMRSSAQTGGAVASSAMAAVNVGASLSHGSSLSQDFRIEGKCG